MPFWLDVVPLLSGVLKTKLKEAVIGGEETLEPVRLDSKQHHNSSNGTCTESRLQCLVQFFNIGAEATPESQTCWP